MKKNTEIEASVLGNYNDKMMQAIQLLRKFGYRVYSAPVSGILTFEVNIFPPDGNVVCITSMKKLEKFLEEKF